MFSRSSHILLVLLVNLAVLVCPGCCHASWRFAGTGEAARESTAASCCCPLCAQENGDKDDAAGTHPGRSPLKVPPHCQGVCGGAIYKVWNADDADATNLLWVIPLEEPSLAGLNSATPFPLGRPPDHLAPAQTLCHLHQLLLC